MSKDKKGNRQRAAVKSFSGTIKSGDSAKIMQELKEKEEQARLEREKEEKERLKQEAEESKNIEITHKNNHDKKPLLKNNRGSTDFAITVEKLEQDGPKKASELEQPTKASHNRSVSFGHERHLYIHEDGSKHILAAPLKKLEQDGLKQKNKPKQNKEDPQKLNHNQEQIQAKSQEQAQKQPEKHHHGKKKHQAATVTVDDTKAIEALKAEIKKWSEQGKTDVVKGLQRELATKERKQNKGTSAVKNDTTKAEKIATNVQPDDKTQSAHSAEPTATLAQKAESTPSKSHVAALRKSFEPKPKTQGQEKTQLNDPVLQSLPQDGKVKKALEQFNQTPAAKALQETQQLASPESRSQPPRKGPKHGEGMNR